MLGSRQQQEELCSGSFVLFQISTLATLDLSKRLPSADVTSLLPAADPTHIPDDDLSNSPLSPHNPSFLMAHPPHLVQATQLYLKAVILLGRVVSFMQRAPTPIGMGLPPPRKHPDDPSEPLDIRTTSV